MSNDDKGWTVDTLLQLMNERDLRYEQRFIAQEKHIAAAEANAEKWRVNANEWREAMNDRERNFLSKGMGYVVGALGAISLAITIIGQLKS